LIATINVTTVGYEVWFADRRVHVYLHRVPWGEFDHVEIDDNWIVQISSLQPLRFPFANFSFFANISLHQCIFLLFTFILAIAISIQFGDDFVPEIEAPPPPLPQCGHDARSVVLQNQVLDCLHDLSAQLEGVSDRIIREIDDTRR
jgi:hypothetical protein